LYFESLSSTVKRKLFDTIKVTSAMPSSHCAQRSEHTALAAAPFRAGGARAKPGERFEYHRGRLGIDRVKETSSLSEPERRRLNAVADHALSLAGQGKLHLLQQRHGHADYSYWAIARAPSDSVVARIRLPATAAQDKSAIADVADPQAGAPHHPELSMAAHLLEREEVVQ
jgi:hypothetical protein